MDGVAASSAMFIDFNDHPIPELKMTALDDRQYWRIPSGKLLLHFQKPVLVALAYFIGAEAAFLVGTLSDKIFAPFWPPNAILLCALLAAPAREWWLYVLFAFPAHAVAEAGVGMSFQQMLAAFATNCILAVASAAAVRKLIDGHPLGTLRNTSSYIIIAGALIPAAVALGGAFVPISGGQNPDLYWRFWAEWYASNALGCLTLAPAILIWVTYGSWPLRLHSKSRLVEAIALALLLIVACHVAFAFDLEDKLEGFLPSLIYLPLPLIILAGLRFGNRGASLAILIVTIDLVWRSLDNRSLFVSASSETTVFALQTFLIGLSVLTLLLGASVDETRDAARAMREIEERTTFAAASAHTGLWEYNIEESRFWTTDVCKALFGYPPEARLSPKSLIAAVHPDDRPAATAALRVDVPSHEPGHSEFRVLLPEGTTRWIRAQARVYRDERGTPLRIGGIFSDVTSRKESEIESEQRRRDLVHLTRVSILGELSGAIAHEINQPLTSILVNAQAARLMLAQSPPKIQDAIEAVDDIVRENTRATQIIARTRGLLKKGEIRCEPVKLGALVDETLKLLHSEFIAKRVKLKVELEPKLPTIHGDPIQLQQVILNVIVNAIEAMATTPIPQRIVTIRAAMKDGFVETVIADRGRGIAPEHRELVQEPFFTTKATGLGLGLSICTTIMTSHGGDLRIVNNPDGGAIVYLTLPIGASGANHE